MSAEQRKAIKKIKNDIKKAHNLFSSADDAQHAYLDVAEKCMNMVLNDPYYGCIKRG